MEGRMQFTCSMQELGNFGEIEDYLDYDDETDEPDYSAKSKLNAVQQIQRDIKAEMSPSARAFIANTGARQTHIATALRALKFKKVGSYAGRNDGRITVWLKVRK